MSHAAEVDAHGHQDHGHTIVSLATLRLVLAALLFFTLATVGTAWLEVWIAHVFNIEIPQWINVTVALSIAVVKTVLVCLIFMQLKYDNPMNTLILVFTILTVGFFLGFTALDLGKRSTVDRRKGQYVMEGGTGLKGGGPITQTAREDAIASGKYDPHKAHHDHGGPNLTITESGFWQPRAKVGSDANVSRPVEGLTLPGLVTRTRKTDHAHDAQKADEKKPEAAKPEPAKNDPTKE